MGDVARKRRRSLSRHTAYVSDSSSGMSTSDSNTFTDSSSSESDYDGRRRRKIKSQRNNRAKKKRRYSYVISDSDERDVNISDSDEPLAKRSRSSVGSRSDSIMANDPSDRFSHPMEMVTRMNSLMDKCYVQMGKLKSTFKKMETLNKRFNIEMWEMRKDFSNQGALSGYGSQMTQGPLAIDYPSTSRQHSSTSRSRQNSGYGESFGTSNGAFSNAVEQIRPPSSLQSANSRQRVKSEDFIEGTMSSGMVTIRGLPNAPREIGSNSLNRQVSGYRRVFESANFDIPIANQPTMSIFSIGNKRIIEKASVGRAPRPMMINPFSRNTRFDGIAATCSTDGIIQFWDINTQEKVLSIPYENSFVIPYAESVVWVSEDTVVAASHLKKGVTWMQAKAAGTPSESSMPPPQFQTNLITLYFNQENRIAYRVVTIESMPHTKSINTVVAVMRDDYSMSYVTGGIDRTLYHWKFRPPVTDTITTYDPEGLDQIHKLHTNTVTSLEYSHISKNLYSGGRDGRYVCYNLEHEKVYSEVKLGTISHINRNPADPRINLVTLQTHSDQFLLMDERIPGRHVLKLGFKTESTITKQSYPSWHPDGGLICAGTIENGVVNVWDIRWSNIKSPLSRRPGSGVVTGDVQFDRVITGNSTPSRHPIFRKRPNIDGDFQEAHGGPSQILGYGGSSKVIHVAFHPTKNTMITQFANNNLGFM
ncbi:hypothetical protein BGZ76_003657 [Entomortierella beljakovae]|nr:hypothetical protein BGZ76_003657 [Entomortierella beljakovae]